MSHDSHRVQRGLVWCALFLVAAVGLPLLGLVVFALRGFLLVAAILALVSGALLYCLNPGFRSWVQPPVGDPLPPRGPRGG